MKRGIGIVLLCVVVSVGYGQSSPVGGPKPPPLDLQKVVPATPNATKMTEFYAQKPNMYTGTANVSIPFYTIDFDGWKLPISISYNATGIRTNEEASEVGLGWSLNATAVISRSVNGGDDFFCGPSGYGKGYVVADRALSFDMEFDDGDYDAQNNHNNLPPSYFTSYYAYLVQKKPDTQPDVFNYNFFGYSGSFVLTQQVRGPVKVVKITQDPCLIDFDFNAKKFTVTTPQGFKGTFDIQERSTTASSGPSILLNEHRLDCCLEGYIDYTYLKESSGTFRTVTSWYLSKIRSPRGKEIDFTYDLVDGRSYNVSVSRAFPEGKETDRSTRVCSQTIQEHVYLTKIASDEVRVDFTMEDRDDLRKNNFFIATTQNPINPLSSLNFPNGNKLKRYNKVEVQGLHGSTLDKTIILKQSYFNRGYWKTSADDEDEANYLRSRLDRVIIDDQVYLFYYEKAGELPNKLTTAVDHFGFYNGADENADLALLPPEILYNNVYYQDSLEDTTAIETYWPRRGREVSFDYGKAGVLSKVIYPTGGYTLFTYEDHRYESDEPYYFKESHRDFGGYHGGGTRIKTIEEYDYDGSLARTRNYYYVEDPEDSNSPSTGHIMTPLLNRYARTYTHPGQSEPWRFSFERKSFAGIPGSHAAQGKLIGYSKVYEEVKGTDNGSVKAYRTVHYFENKPNDVYKFNSVAIGAPNVNGQLIKSQSYDSDKKLVQSVVNDKYNNVIDSSKVNGLMYEVQPYSYTGQGTDAPTFLNYWVPYGLDRTFITPLEVRTTTYATTGDDSSVVKITYAYNDSTRLLSSQKIVISVNDSVITYYKRPFDYDSPSDTISMMASKDIYMIEPVIEEIVVRKMGDDSVIVSAKANQYAKSEFVVGDFFNLKKTYLWNPKLGQFAQSVNGSRFPSPYELRLTYDAHDEFGKILQYTSSDGTPNSFIYKDDLPIVHGVNVNYSALLAAYNAASGDEAAIRNHANTIGKQVTTYEHDPLVGVTSVTDPNQLKTTYAYDEFKRLRSVVDNDGKLREQYEYNFRKLPPVYSAAVAEPIIDFGTKTTGIHGDQIILGQRLRPCEPSSTKVITITNTGTEDITLKYTPTQLAFRVQAPEGILVPGDQIALNADFNVDNNLTPQQFSTPITFEIHKPSDNSLVSTISVTLKALLETVQCQPTDPIVADFGVKIGGGDPKIIDLDFNNTGNIGYRVWAAEYHLPTGWEGYYEVDEAAFPTGCVMPIGPGVTNPTVSIAFKPPTPMTAPMEGYVLFTNTECPAIRVNLSGQRIDDNAYQRHLKISPGTIPQLQLAMQDSAFQFITVKNDGSDPVIVTGITTNNGDNTLRVFPNAFMLNVGQTKDLMVSFKPDLTDLSQHSRQFTFQALGGVTGGAQNFTVTGQRQLVRDINIDLNPLTFFRAHDPMDVTITNRGNKDITITGIHFSTPNSGPSYAPIQTSEWSASLSGPATTLRPCIGSSCIDSQKITVQLLTSDDPADVVIVVEFNSSSSGLPAASENFTVKAELTRLGYPTSPTTLTSLDMETYQEGTVYLYNYGNMPFKIKKLELQNHTVNHYDIPFFTIVSPTPTTSNPITLNPYNGTAGSNVLAVKIRYTPDLTDLTMRQVRLVADADAAELVGGSYATITGQRQSFTQLTFSPGLPSPITLNFSGNKTLTAIVTNTGNTPVMIHSIYIDEDDDFTTTITPSGFAGHDLQPESQISVYIVPKTYQNPSSRRTSLRIQYGSMINSTEWILLSY